MMWQFAKYGHCLSDLFCAVPAFGRSCASMFQRRPAYYWQMYNTCSQNRQSTKFQNHENINFVEKLYFFILYNQVYIAKHVVKSLHSGFIFRENTSHYKVGG